MGNSVKERFAGEINAIKNYVDYIENNFYSRSKKMLQIYEFADELEILKNYVFFPETSEDRESNKNIIKELQRIIQQEIDKRTDFLKVNEQKELPALSPAILASDSAEELCGYIHSTVYDCMDNPYNLPFYELIDQMTPEEIKREVDDLEELADEKNYESLDVADYYSLLQYMKCRIYNNELEYCQSELYEYEELQTLYKIFDDETPINIYRQSFILLLTAFDAVVFDLAKELFKRKFFEIAPIINYDKKFSLSDIAQASSFDEFSSQTMETVVSKKYISDLLDILYNYDNTMFIIDGVNCYDEIMEIVQRRNLHVHKNGIVDEKYFSKGNGRRYGMNVGDYASIDDLYFYRAFDLLSSFVEKIPNE